MTHAGDRRRPQAGPWATAVALTAGDEPTRPTTRRTPPATITRPRISDVSSHGRKVVLGRCLSAGDLPSPEKLKPCHTRAAAPRFTWARLMIVTTPSGTRSVLACRPSGGGWHFVVLNGAMLSAGAVRWYQSAEHPLHRFHRLPITAAQFRAVPCVLLYPAATTAAAGGGRYRGCSTRTTEPDGHERDNPPTPTT